MNKDLIAIIAALDDEIRIVHSKMTVDEKIHIKPSVITRGQLNKRDILLARSGIGKMAMQNAVDYCLSNFKPSFCLNVGYAGGTTPHMSAGDLIIATTVIDQENGRSYSADTSLVDKAGSICRQKELKAMRGGLVTVGRVIPTPHEKAFIGTEHDALAIDMESSSFMERCLAAGVPAIVVRAILDPLDVALPDMNDVIGANGKMSLNRVAGHLVHHPKDTLALHKIEYCAIKAREAIAELVEAWTSL
jgi:adenosylhomocysteine nucleosidase